MKMRTIKRGIGVLFSALLIGCVSVSGAAASEFKGVIGKDFRDSQPYWPEPVQAPEDSPNIVIVLMDDVGFADLGCFGGEIRTPHMDRLAKTGLRYSHFTTTSVCSPSRGALLTGLNHHSAGMGWVAEWDQGYPGYQGEIAKGAVTLAEVLQTNGYSTLMVGKWHLTNLDHRSVVGPYDSWPTHRGFDRYWGFLGGAVSQWYPEFLFNGTEQVDIPQDDSFYFPDAMTDKAIEMLRNLRAVAPDKPFFLYYATGAAHAPHHTKAEDRAKYRGVYDEGWDELRQKCLARQKQLGIMPETAKLAPYYPGVVPWETMSADERRMASRLMENYGAFVDNIDQNVGRLIAYLEQTGELDNTIFIVLSDNGASRETGSIGTTNQFRFFYGVKDTLELNLKDYDRVGEPETNPNYSHGWMQVSNTPFKYSKTTCHGGGNRDPLIISWPAKIMARSEIRMQYHHINDLMPTILDALNIPHPAHFEGQKIKPMEGVSMTYSFANADAKSPKKEQYYEMMGNRGMYVDGWKIVSYIDYTVPYDSVPWELYNLNKDFSESNDLAAQFPEKVAELEEKWWEHGKRYNVLPIDDREVTKRIMTLRVKQQMRKKYIYYPGTHAQVPAFAPTLINKSFNITAYIDRKHEAEDGVLVARGDAYSGYTFYIKDNHLHYEVNFAKTLFPKVSSPIELPTGELQVRFKFDKGSSFGGTGSLFVNEKKVAEAPMRVSASASFGGLDIGKDSKTPVSSNYSSPFAFKGTLKKVIYELD